MNESPIISPIIEKMEKLLIHTMCPLMPLLNEVLLRRPSAALHLKNVRHCQRISLTATPEGTREINY